MEIGPIPPGRISQRSLDEGERFTLAVGAGKKPADSENEPGILRLPGERIEERRLGVFVTSPLDQALSDPDGGIGGRPPSKPPFA